MVQFINTLHLSKEGHEKYIAKQLFADKGITQRRRRIWSINSSPQAICRDTGAGGQGQPEEHKLHP